MILKLQSISPSPPQKSKSKRLEEDHVEDDKTILSHGTEENRSPNREEGWMEVAQDKLEEDAREGFWAFKACYKKPTSKKIN